MYDYRQKRSQAATIFKNHYHHGATEDTENRTILLFNLRALRSLWSTHQIAFFWRFGLRLRCSGLFMIEAAVNHAVQP
jgi:hypothetical protein